MAKGSPSYAEARNRLISATASLRIYGVPLDGAEDADRYQVFRLCGWGIGVDERQEGSDRILRVRKDQVTASGEVPGFEHRGHQVHWYEVDMGAHLVEELYVSIPASQIVPIRFGGVVAQIPVTIDPNGPRPTETPPGTIEPNGPRPTGAPPGTITP